MKDLIDFQEGSVVSRQLIKKDTGNVTLFAFDQGEGLSEHTAPFEALVLVIDGKAEIIIDKLSFSVNEGEMIILPANIPHAVKANEKFKMVLVMIKTN
ncbi:MAG TPA: cupin domain-containing protein [candidate division Zixibacteria bacterium]|nr:cupin domain-containing protein [candidate division Zixibacteria bacterium]